VQAGDDDEICMRHRRTGEPIPIHRQMTVAADRQGCAGMAIPTGMATVMNPYGPAVILGRFDFQTDVRLSGNAFPEVKRKGNEND